MFTEAVPAFATFELKRFSLSASLYVMLCDGGDGLRHSSCVFVVVVVGIVGGDGVRV